MAIYSHSKISTFENCPYQYKLKYVDNIEPDIPQGIEAFMGNIVHIVLEYLHKETLAGKIPSKGELISLYNSEWLERYDPRILIVKKQFTENDYKTKGMIFIRDYYDRLYPFEKLNIIDLETQNKMTLKNGSEWHVRIDKLCKDEEGNYYVCDYKTNGRMKTREEVSEDRQLAMYSLWVQEKYSDAKSVKLIWHMLAFNEDLVSERTEEQLKLLEEKLIEKINEIEKSEREKNFPPNVSKLCEWCLYQNICPEYQKAKKVWDSSKK